MRYLTIKSKEAESLGYVAVTSAYSKTERELMSRAIQDMRETDYVLVSDDGGDNITIFRNKKEVKKVDK
jgi:hypothetical protein